MYNEIFKFLSISPVLCQFSMYFSGCGEFGPPKPSLGYATVMFLRICIHSESSIKWNEISQIFLKSSLSSTFKGVLIEVGPSLNERDIRISKKIENDILTPEPTFSCGMSLLSKKKKKEKKKGRQLCQSQAKGTKLLALSWTHHVIQEKFETRTNFA